jgi:ADP-ribose pyrophosphatase
MTETGEEQDSVPDQRRIQILAQDRVFDGFLAIDRYTIIHQQRNGSLGEPITRLILERGDSAAVLPYQPDTQRLVLVRQLRLAAHLRGDDAWLWELIAGTCQPGCRPEDVARNEAREEAGYRLGAMQPLGVFYPSPGGSSERIYLYWADLREAQRVGAGGGLPHSGEDIQVAEFSLDAALAMVRNGAIVDAKTIIALQHLALAGKGLP